MRAVIEEAALISGVGDKCDIFGGVLDEVRTAFSCYQLANLAVDSAMDVWIKWRKTRDGDVASQEVEFGDTIPHITLRRELISGQWQSSSRMETL